MNIVVGSGPNGLAAAIVLAQAGLAVEVREAAPTPGGATRSGELTLPGFIHDLGAAVFPMALASPFFSKLPLQQYGLQWIRPDAALAHPFDDGTALLVERDINTTAAQLGSDRDAYRKLFEPLVKNWTELADGALRPIGWPSHPFLMARFGIRALQPAVGVARSLFHGRRARALFAGLAAHSNLPLEHSLSASFGLIMCAAAHAVGWPIAQGGSQHIANALVRVLESLGGRVAFSSRVETLPENPEFTLCDVTPRQFLELSGPRLPVAYKTKLEKYKYGPAVFKVDWALREPIPWKAKDCRCAATIHLGATLEEIAASEREISCGRVGARPFVLLVQPSLFDASRAPEGRHTAWAYCHVPNGSTVPALGQIESQIERFAPGFRECILACAVHTPAQLQDWDENLVGGDVVGGAVTPMQFFFRPTWRHYATPLRRVYLCSSSTPPGGAVHGMCGYWAAQSALRNR
jgi:phytoene dehydrogenase-like protein